MPLWKVDCHDDGKLMKIGLWFHPEPTLNSVVDFKGGDRQGPLPKGKFRISSIIESETRIIAQRVRS